MKVKEFIDKLKSLDQEKEIHLVYDRCYDMDIKIEIADDCVPESVKDGDYIINAW